VDALSAGEKASTAVIEAVADREGTNKADLPGPVLFEAIDPDALNALCRNDSVRVSFNCHGYLVTVDSENNVELTAAT
jgi:hypothetical protein